MNCKKLSKIVFMTLCVLTMPACSWQTKPQAMPVVQPLPDLPANLKAPCGQSQELRTGQASEVLTLMIDDRRKLAQCHFKHKSIVDLWKETQKQKPSK